MGDPQFEDFYFYRECEPRESLAVRGSRGKHLSMPKPSETQPLLNSWVYYSCGRGDHTAWGTMRPLRKMVSDIGYCGFGD